MLRRFGTHGVIGIGGIPVFGGGTPGIVINYLLRDEFTDIRAAGGVNGTLATPGPGTRAIVDTGNRLSVSTNRLRFSGGGGAGDPAYWLDSISRVLGRYQKLETIKSGIVLFSQSGWDSNQIGPIIHGISMSGGNIQSVDGGIGGPVIGVYLAAVSYEIVVLLRANTSGFYVYIKGGSFTAWTLLWVSNNNANHANMSPSIQARDTDTFDFIRIPDRLFIPPITIYDTFTDPNGTLLSAHTSDAIGPDGQATDLQSIPTIHNGAFDIQGNRANQTTVAPGRYTFAYLTTFSDAFVSAIVNTPTRALGLGCRLTDNNNFWQLVADTNTNQVQLEEVNGGVSAIRDSSAVVLNIATDYELKLSMNGNDFQGYLDNANRVSFTSAFNNSAVRHGARTRDTNDNIDDFVAYPLTDSRYDDEFNLV